MGNHDPNDDLSRLEDTRIRPPNREALLSSIAVPSPTELPTEEHLPDIDWQIGGEEEHSHTPRPTQLNIGLIQFQSEEDKHANIQRALSLAWESASAGADIITFHEMFMLPWVFSDDEAVYEPLADSTESSVWEPFKTLAAQKNVVLVCSFFERGVEDRNYNSALVIDSDGRIAGAYRKRHIPPDNERVHFTAGSGPFSAFPTRKGRIGVYICWDNFFPEGARAIALDRADIVIAPTAATELDHAYKWRLAIQHNALINGIPWVRLNRIEAPFYGDNFIVDAEGRIVLEIPHQEDDIALATINLKETVEARRKWTFMQDRRPELYGVLARSPQTLTDKS
jgi:predicted amidohydrolase